VTPYAREAGDESSICQRCRVRVSDLGYHKGVRCAGGLGVMDCVCVTWYVSATLLGCEKLGSMCDMDAERLALCCDPTGKNVYNW
jgi:hypothetical protein